MQAFEEVWRTVSLFCFDEAVCGKKWDGLKLKYKPLVASVKTDEELHILLQRMLNELNTSHFHIVPKTFENKKEAPQWGIGVDLAIFDSQLVITKVYPGSPAEKVSLRPGFAITKIDGTDVDQLISRYKTNPLWGGKNWKVTVKGLIHGFFLNGPQSSPVNVTFVDRENSAHQMQLERDFMYQPKAVLEHKVLEGGAGYIKLRVFDQTKMAEFCAAVRSMNDAPAIILDLRDNPGGMTSMTEAIAGLLVSKPVKLGRMFKNNASSWDPFAEQILESYPQAKPYRGRLVVLINEGSGSSSEILAAGLRENGHAVIVGKPSMGEVMPSMVMPLPTAAVLQVAVSEFETASGVKLEGKGVTPDIAVDATRDGLLENTDEQLRAAIDVINKNEIFSFLRPIERKQVIGTGAAVANGRSENDASATADPKVDAILDNYTSAIGGRAAIEKLHSRVVTGTVKNSITGVNGKFTIYDRLPDKYMIITRYEDGTVEQTAINGAEVWTFHSQLGVRKFDKAEATRRKLMISPYPALDPASSFKQRFKRIHFLQEETSSKNQPAYLLAAGNGGDDDPLTDYFSFDKNTGLLLKAVFQYSDYRVVENVRVPFSIEVQGMISYKVDQVSHNIDIAAGIFERPVDSCFTSPK
jgi:carboxyl-terminal processing protease